jgi:hypothetical protein
MGHPNATDSVSGMVAQTTSVFGGFAPSLLWMFSLSLGIEAISM